MSYPFQLEWIEGQSMDIVRRAREGHAIYAAPTLEYVSLLYTPLFYYFSVVASWFTGMDFIAGRLVSTLSIFGVAAVFFQWVRREGGNWQCGLLTTGLLFATYRLSGRWFDIARVDSLALFLSVAALYLLRFGEGKKTAIRAGLLACAAFYAKQTSLGLLIPPLCAAIFLNRRFGLTASAAAAISLLVTITLYQLTTGGWFWFYTMKIPMNHNTDPLVYFAFWRDDLLRLQGYVLGAALIAVGFWCVTDRKKAIFYGVLALTAITVCYSARLHRYGYYNNLMPMHAILALVAGLGFADQLRQKPRLAIASGLLIFAQLISLIYDPLPLAPSPKSAAAADAFLAEIGTYKGDAFMPDIQFISERVGKKTYSYGMAAYDLFRANLGPDTGLKVKLGKELETAIAQQKFGVIIPGKNIHYNLPNLNMYYRMVKYMDYPEGYALDSLNNRRLAIYVPITSKP